MQAARAAGAATHGNNAATIHWQSLHRATPQVATPHTRTTSSRTFHSQPRSSCDAVVRDVHAAAIRTAARRGLVAIDTAVPDLHDAVAGVGGGVKADSEPSTSGLAENAGGGVAGEVAACGGGKRKQRGSYGGGSKRVKLTHHMP